MFLQRGKRAFTTIAGAAGFALAAPATATPVSIRALGAEQMRIATIGYRIAVGSPQACSVPDMMTGLIVHDLTQYERTIRPAVSRAFSLRTGIGVLEMVPGSAAELAGLRVDDEILAIGGRSIEMFDATEHPDRSYRRIEHFNAALANALRTGKTQLIVNRRGRITQITLNGQPGCGGDARLADSNSLNAWSDGRHVAVTRSMAALAHSPDELAFVIAHEMAHNTLGHSGPRGGERGLVSLFGFGLGAKQLEVDADTYAVQLMSAGGYSPEGGVAFLERARRRLWWNFSLDHPGFGRRLAIVRNAMTHLPSRGRTEVLMAQAPDAPTTPMASVALAQPLHRTVSKAKISWTMRDSTAYPSRSGSRIASLPAALSGPLR